MCVVPTTAATRSSRERAQRLWSAWAHMPTTRAARAAAARSAARERNEQASLLCRLPLELQASILFHLPLAHDIALTGLACHSLCDAAKLASKSRPVSSAVINLKGETGWICNRLSVSPAGQIVAISGPVIKVWSSDGEELRSVVMASERDVSKMALLPDGERFLASSGHELKMFKLNGDLERIVVQYSDECQFIHRMMVMPDGLHFVVGLGTDDLYRYEVRLYHVDGTLVHIFESHFKRVTALASTQDGQHIISGSRDQLVKVWSVATKSLVSAFVGADAHAAVNAVAAMPDGQRFLSASSAGTWLGYVQVNLLDETREGHFKLHTRAVRSLVALPDNRHALSGSADKTIKLFNVNDGDVLRTFTHHTHLVSSLVLLPDGLRFVSGGDDDKACIVYHGLAPQ